MTAISIRNLDSEVKAKLRIRAAQHGRSMEAEIRAILTDAVAQRPVGFFEAIRALSLEHGGNQTRAFAAPEFVAVFLEL